MTRTSTPRAFAAPSACTTSSRPSSYISTITRSWAEPISPLTRVKMLASCQRRTSAPGGGPSGGALAGREQPARERRMESKQAARTTAGKNYAARVQAPTQPAKEAGLDRLHPHARPRAERRIRPRAKRVDRHTRSERRSGRGEHVAAFERRGGVGSRGKLVHRLHTNLVDHDGEEPVVRADVETPAGLDDEAPPRAPHAWI